MSGCCVSRVSSTVMGRGAASSLYGEYARQIGALLRKEVDAVYMKGARGLRAAHAIDARLVFDISTHPDPLVRVLAVQAARGATGRDLEVGTRGLDVDELDVVRRETGQFESDQEPVQRLGPPALDDAAVDGQPEAAAPQVGERLDARPGQCHDALELVGPVEADDPRLRAGRARPQGRHVAALPDGVREVVVQVRLAQARVVGLLQREHLDAVVVEFLEEPAELGRQAHRARVVAARVVQPGQDWVHGGGCLGFNGGTPRAASAAGGPRRLARRRACHSRARR